MRTFILVFCSMFIAGISGFAQQNCKAPAPADLHVVEAGHDYITVAWTPVLGADSYRVTTTPTGSSILTSTTSFTTNPYFTQTGLDPGETYTISVQASYCHEGPYGQASSIVAKTSIVIVDIVFQLDVCNDADAVEEEFAPNDQLVLEIPSNSRACHFLQGEVLASSGGPIPFLFAMTNHGGAQLGLSYAPAMTPQFRIGGIGPAVGEYLPYSISPFPFNTNVDWEELFTLEAEYDDTGNMAAIITWSQNVTAATSVCNSCVRGGGVAPLQGSGSSPQTATAFSLYPNPVRNRLELELPSAGHFEIWSITGRRFYAGTVQEGASMIGLNVEHLPAGSYFLRWYGHEEVPITKQFLKL
jgi:hypothetical protein